MNIFTIRGQTPGQPCGVCDRLRGNYESALLALLRAESQLQIAVFAGDAMATGKLEHEIEGLAENRRVIRASLVAREASAHASQEKPDAILV